MWKLNFGIKKYRFRHWMLSNERMVKWHDNPNWKWLIYQRFFIIFITTLSIILIISAIPIACIASQLEAFSTESGHSVSSSFFNF